MKKFMYFHRSEGPFSHDLALVKLQKKVRFSPEVSPVCLPEHGFEYRDGLECVVSGWGQTSPSGQVHTDCLRAAKVPIMNQQGCEKDYQQSSQGLIKSMLCAGYPGGGVDACKGDSGGPLACYINGEYR